MVIAVALPSPGSVPVNHSARVIAEAVSVAEAVNVTVVAPWVGFGVTDTELTVGRTLSMTSATDATGPQLPAPSLACTNTVCTPSASSATDGAFNSATEAGYASVPLSTVALLADGVHTVFVHARDGAGNWGPVASVALVIDKVRPTVSSVSVTPNPTQGATTVTLTASATDTASAITRAEWFTGTDPGLGNATAMTITGTGPWTATSTPINVSGWAEGTYTLTVRARDAAGNWSLTATTVVTVTAALRLSTFGNTNPPGVGGAADDAVLYNNNGTWSVYFDGTANGLTDANEDLDAISIVGAVNGTGGTLYFSTLGNTNPPGVTGTADDADIYSWNATTYTRVWDATTNGLPAAANVDGYVRTDTTHFYLSFSPTTTTVPGLGAVQDEDVIYNNNATWSTYFNGTAHGLTTDNLDTDAFDIP